MEMEMEMDGDGDGDGDGGDCRGYGIGAMIIFTLRLLLNTVGLLML